MKMFLNTHSRCFYVAVFFMVLTFCSLAEIEKPRIAVGEFRYSEEFDLRQTKDRRGVVDIFKPVSVNRSKTGSTEKSEDQDATSITKRAPVLRDMVTTALVTSRKFEVIERARMDEMLSEMGLGETGVLDADTAKKIGSVIGTDYIVIGTITQFAQGKENKGWIIGGKNLAKVIMSVDIRVLDAKTGVITTAATVQEDAERGATGTGVLGAGVGSEEGGLVGAVMRQTADGIVEKVVTSIFPLKIIHTTDEYIMINYGEGFLDVGERLSVYSQGEEITDPDTGEVIAFEEKHIGDIEITEVSAKFSKARVIKGEGFERGMVCRTCISRSHRRSGGQKESGTPVENSRTGVSF